MTFILTRHAKATHNTNNVFAGSYLDTKLTLEGKNEAEKFAAEIAKKYWFEVIVCSTLTRTYQTAIIFQKALMAQYQKSVPIIKTIYLNEVNVGVINGMTFSKAAKKFPKEYANIQSRNIDDWTFEGGESPAGLQKRYLKLVDFLKQYKNQNVLLVGHAMFNQVILKNALGLENFEFSHSSLVELTDFDKKL